MAKTDLTGQRFGRLIALRRHPDLRGHHATYICQCDCGAVLEKKRSKLVTGHVRSCGCFKRDSTSARRKKHGESHGLDGRASKLFHVWCNMRQRTTNPNAAMWRYYGGRGIRVCSEWGEFAAFRDWAAANGYKQGLTIDRIDVDGHYEPNNCRWADATTQNRNKRSVVKLEIGGVIATIPEHAQRHGLRPHTVYNRHRRGRTGEDLVAPVRR